MSVLKIRLHGTSEDVDRAAEVLRTMFQVLSEAGNYADRPPSVYVRRYLDVEPPPKESRK